MASSPITPIRPKKILFASGILAASIAVAPAASIVVNTVGTINGNNTTVSEATGNSLTASTFASDIATAFANNTGGVWDFEATYSQIDPGETITLNYGDSQLNDLVLTLGGGDINRSTNAGEPTSGIALMGLVNDGAVTRTFTPDKPLLTVGIFNSDRNATGRNPMLTVVFQDTTTASTSGAHADDTFFHGLSGTEANPIVRFELSQENFVRYDDLGFIVVPEPSAALLGGLGALALFRRRRA